MAILLIDNYDSFTYNLFQYFGELGAAVQVVRNDAISLQEIEAAPPSHIVISPGPCTPNESGISLAVIKQFAGRIPILGVCLGHQAIAQVFGARIIRAAQVMHGKTSRIRHQAQGVFQGLPASFLVTRYHSLMIDPQTLPADFKVTAWVETEPSAIMAIKHRIWPLEGVQFHPEAILTEHGHTLLRNFLTTHVCHCEAT